MGAIIVLAVIGIIVFVIIISIKTQNIKNSQEKALREIPDFTASFRFDPDSDSPGIALDPQSNRFAILNADGSLKVYKFSQILSVDVEKDGMSVQKTNRGNQVAKAAIGGILLGPAGLLFGGLMGSKRNVEKTKRLSLKIFTDDLASPVTELVFFNNPSGQSPDGLLVQFASKKLDEWHGRFMAIIQHSHCNTAGVAEKD